MTERRQTTMESAFSRLPASVLATDLGRRVGKALITRQGIKPKDAQGWKANLSYKTYRSLANKGALQQ